MTANSVIGLLVLPAVSFGLLYLPALTRISPTLASPYPKADVSRRVLAAAVDGSLFLTSLYFSLQAESAWFFAAGAAYVGMRDGMRGRSVGKFFAGLVVISLETGKPCSVAGSVTRNLVFLFPGVNLVAVVLEGVTAGRDLICPPETRPVRVLDFGRIGRSVWDQPGGHTHPGSRDSGSFLSRGHNWETCQGRAAFCSSFCWRLCTTPK